MELMNNSLSVLQINISRIVQNYLQVKSSVGSASVSAVMKADCYGLGAEEIAPELHKVGCTEFYVATIDEAIALRSVVPGVKIYILSGVNKGEEYYFLKHGVIPVLNNFEQIERWKECSKNLDEKLDASLQFDIGMTRLGVDLEKLDDAIKSVEAFADIDYILGHLSNATSDQKHDKKQLSDFKQIQTKYPQFKYSIANSGVLSIGGKYICDQVRPGIFLYNNNSNGGEVVTLTSEIIQIIQAKKGRYVGYGCTHRTKVDTIIGTVPVGYADGYPFALSNKGFCYVEGQKVPVVGRVNMDYIMLDITSLPQNLQNVGQKVTLIGEKVNIDKVADLAGTIPYEILCSLSKRYKREYIR
jgi:alanine racemase